MAAWFTHLHRLLEVLYIEVQLDGFRAGGVLSGLDLGEVTTHTLEPFLGE